MSLRLSTYVLRGKYFIRKFLMYVFSHVYKIEKKIVFISFGGKQYSDNPRYISEKMHEVYPDFKCIWILNDACDKYGIIPSYVRKVSVKKRFQVLREMSTAFCVISNNQFEDYYYKHRKQYYINTWHGNNPLKKILHDAYPLGNRPMPVMDNKLVDLCITGSGFGKDLYHSAMRYFGRIFDVGTPRNDILVKNDVQLSMTVRRRLGIADGEKVLLYAPTFRDNSRSKQETVVNLSSVMRLLNTNDRWICLLRAHPATKELKYKGDDDNLIILDVSDYPDMAELLLIADMLITDYSSCASDMILRNKPAIMAQFDYEDYRKKCRDFYFEMDELPFFIAKTQAELEEMIMGLTAEKVEENCRKIKEFYQINETGESAKEICKIIHAEYIRRFETKER